MRKFGGRIKEVISGASHNSDSHIWVEGWKDGDVGGLKEGEHKARVEK